MEKEREVNLDDLQNQLNPLRREVASLDREILAKIAQRLEITRSIGEWKHRAGVPIRDYTVEVQVLKRARETAVQEGLDLDLAEQIVELLMSAAVQTQSELLSSHQAEKKQKILVVGGAGRMGRWLCEFFLSMGHEVKVFDTIDDKELAPLMVEDFVKDFASYDVVVFSTPLAHTASLMEPLLELSAGPLIFDICSLKSPLEKVLARLIERGHLVTSLHPMFAPGTQLLKGRAVLVCDCGCEEANERAQELFSETAMSLYPLEIAEHDRLMAVVLGMSHLHNLTFALAAQKWGFSFDFLGKIASTTFAKQAKTSSEVVAENRRLYHQIQHLNVHSPKVYQTLEEVVSLLKEASFDEDPKAFEELMNCGYTFFYGD